MALYTAVTAVYSGREHGTLPLYGRVQGRVHGCVRKHGHVYHHVHGHIAYLQTQPCMRAVNMVYTTWTRPCTWPVYLYTAVSENMAVYTTVYTAVYKGRQHGP